ncbi:hypothetical protein M409DRAFT_17984 [Zasmidium cellare ATCC 36951]|uniref:Methyltransferase domain-containing protein n=1 Tax=Zasmidium cellare ATCC 36951 TaxID=1080233 RepID=A0A6A6D0Y1_ZASCE|nr:uncharacterized protein M409DRAFT_17984 [Zasmidium cellare ATCC 36951]KAF2171749.1 hypothetical protein M409DRAFT_17984 [Zasmidium cellare ATCC 36951]
MDVTEEAARVAKQHEYISKGLGFVLHPTIEHDLGSRKEHIKIANVSGAYDFPGAEDTDVAAKLTYSHPIHFDFKDIISPDSSILKEHQGQFDIVAVRLLHASLSTGEWEQTIKGLMALLRPGGWLQWTDWDPLTPRIAAINPAASDKALRDVLTRYVDLLKAKKIGTTYRIPTSMTNLGLEEDDSDMYPLNPEVEFTRNITTGVINFLQDFGGLSAAETEDIRAKVGEEIDVGKPLLWYDLWCHIGRKPM